MYLVTVWLPDRQKLFRRCFPHLEAAEMFSDYAAVNGAPVIEIEPVDTEIFDKILA